MRSFIASAMLLLSICVHAQEPSDVLRYSWLHTTGTARTIGIGGAITALGGDLTSSFVNPAGLAIYKSGELVVSPNINFMQSNSNYFGTSQLASSSNLNLGLAGFAFSTPGSGYGNVQNMTWSVAINKTANFNNYTAYRGKNNQSSYSEKYLEELINSNATDPNSAARDFPYGPSLAFNTFLIEPVLDNNGNATSYFSLATPLTGVIQDQNITTKGGITTLSFAGAANMSDIFMLGASLGIDFLNYQRDQIFTETDATTDLTNNFKYFSVAENLSTKGTGLNLKVGMIVKPDPSFRLGVAFHTPTLYTLKDIYSSSVTTDLEGYAGGVLTQSTSDLIGQSGEFQYSYANPWRVMAGMSYLIGAVSDVSKQKGFVTADIEYLNYTNNSFSDINMNAGNYYQKLNNVVKEIYRSAVNLKLGAEMKFNTLAVRGGLGFYGNPYNSISGLSGSKTNISGGIGYRSKGVFIDFTYLHQFLKDGFYPYMLEQNTYQSVNMRNNYGNVIISFGFKF
ncbi:MAG: OmpP1/FadL family transporter [Chitinophagaceae bacterium]